MTPPKIKDPWQKIAKAMTQKGLEDSFCSNLYYVLGKDRYTTTNHDSYMALALAIRDRIVERWIKTQQQLHKNNGKRVYYLSLEFLIGRLMGSNILNLGLDQEVQKALEAFGLDLNLLREEEVDAGLGNGGLGRLAACFLDSLASLGIPAHGYGIRYDYGIFTQKIIDGHQVEAPDEWLKLGNPWELQRPEYAVPVRFYGRVHTYHDPKGKLCVEWCDTQNVIAMPYDIPILGYKNDFVNTLRLWSARASEDFDLDYFNSGDYEKAVYDKMYSENISRVLYPNDANAMGRELRLKQEYFFTCASIADIIRRYKSENADVRKLHEKVAIQLNDTHPALAVVELMRVLIDEEGLEWEEAWQVTTKTFAYTNHTVLPEALECWKVSLFERLLPRHMQLVYEINSRFLRQVAVRYPGDTERLARMSLLEEGNVKRIRMAHLAIVGSHSVNGVSALHSEILKKDLFRDFHELYPKRLNNKTNGISQRRWLIKSNPGLSRLISEAVGEGWRTNLFDLEKLKAFKQDAGFVQKWQDVKLQNKEKFCRYVESTMGIRLSAESLFDVQVKRIHEYKRQVLFALYIIREYLCLKDNPNAPVVPRTFILGGKAAPGYHMAKMIIKLINSIAEIVNQDPAIGGKLKVVFLENYRVSVAEKIFPASDLSEQISTAGMEASGTGCMKFMVNGALTLGTYDGANIEMAECVGPEAIFMFGLKVDEIEDLRRKGYDPKTFIDRSPELTAVLKLIQSDFFTPNEPGTFACLLEELYGRDAFFVCADFETYCKTQGLISELYSDRRRWSEKTILNVAQSGKFSSDRTIAEYAEEIWRVPVEERWTRRR